MRTVRLFDGRELPAVGLGTWGYGEDAARRAEEVRALQAGLDAGLSVIDTAELYAGGGAERVVAEAIAGRRDDAFIVTKVWPRVTDAAGVRGAVLGSLVRLGVEHVDAVLIHWPSHGLPPAVWVEPILRLKSEGRLRYFGVSNYSERWLRPVLQALPRSEHLAFNQLPYNPDDRRIEVVTHELGCTQAIVTMAYSPFGHRGPGALRHHPCIEEVARARGVSAAQVMLNWLIRDSRVLAVPKASRVEHVLDNAGALDWNLTPEEEEAIASALPDARRPFHPALPPYPTLFRLAYQFETRRHSN